MIVTTSDGEQIKLKEHLIGYYPYVLIQLKPAEDAGEVVVGFDWGGSITADEVKLLLQAAIECIDEHGGLVEPEAAADNG